MSRIDRSKRNIQKTGYAFNPFRPTLEHEMPLREANLKKAAELIGFERNGLRRVFTIRDMLYHHVAQGELAGEPYLVTF